MSLHLDYSYTQHSGAFQPLSTCMPVTDGLFHSRPPQLENLSANILCSTIRGREWNSTSASIPTNITTPPWALCFHLPRVSHRVDSPKLGSHSAPDNHLPPTFLTHAPSIRRKLPPHLLRHPVTTTASHIPPMLTMPPGLPPVGTHPPTTTSHFLPSPAPVVYSPSGSAQSWGIESPSHVWPTRLSPFGPKAGFESPPTFFRCLSYGFPLFQTSAVVFQHSRGLILRLLS